MGQAHVRDSQHGLNISGIGKTKDMKFDQITSFWQLFISNAVELSQGISMVQLCGKL